MVSLSRYVVTLLSRYKTVVAPAPTIVIPHRTSLDGKRGLTSSEISGVGLS